MSGLRFESMADMPPRMRELYARQQIDLSGAAAPAPLAKGSQGKPKYGSQKAERGTIRFDSQKEARLYIDPVLGSHHLPTRTKEYLRNRKMMRSKYGIDIQEV